DFSASFGVPEFPKEFPQSAVTVFLLVRRLGSVHRETIRSKAKFTGFMTLPCAWEPSAFSILVSLLVEWPVTVRQPEFVRLLPPGSLAASLVPAEGLERMRPSVG